MNDSNKMRRRLRPVSCRCCLFFVSWEKNNAWFVVFIARGGSTMTHEAVESNRGRSIYPICVGISNFIREPNAGSNFAGDRAHVNNKYKYNTRGSTFYLIEI